MIKQSTPAPFWISIRVAVAFIGFLGMVCHYSQKVNMSVAIVCMVNHSAIEHHKNIIIGQTEEDLKCPRTISSKIEGPFAWSKNIQGLILGAYFWGYLITEIPAGWLAAKFGAKRLFGYAMVISGIFTIAMPSAAQGHWIILSLLRVFVGLLHGVIWPCMATIMAHWAPPTERSRLMGFMNAGAQIGNVITLPLGAAMCTWRFIGGWPLIFYFSGGIGFVWGIVWLYFYADSPENQRFISLREKTYILESTQNQLASHSKSEFSAPWRAIMTTPACWALFIAHTCNNWGTYTFLTSIPKYMAEVLRFDLKSNGALSALPYIIFWININLSGAVADFIVRKEILTRTQTRKLFNSLGNFIPACFVIGLAFVTCQSKYVGVALLTLGIMFTGCCYGGGFMMTANDIAPSYAGLVFGVSNTFATLPGIISPYIVGTVTSKDPKNWRIVFFICAVIYCVGAVVFLFIGSGEIQRWAVQTHPSTEEGEALRSQESKKDDTTETNQI